MAAKGQVVRQVEHRSDNGLNNRAEKRACAAAKTERAMHGLRSRGGFTTVRVDLSALRNYLSGLIGKLAPGIMTSLARTKARPSALTMMTPTGEHLA